MWFALAIIVNLIPAIAPAEAMEPTDFAQAAAPINQEGQKLAQQPSQTLPVLDPVYDPGYKGTTHSALGGPFVIQVNDSFFRKTASYPSGETIADGTFLFVGIDIFNNSGRLLQIPRFTLQDSRGRTYMTAIRARRSSASKAILAGESLNPGVSKNGYLIFDVPSLSGFDPLPMLYKLLIANSRHTIDINVYKKEE